jgi:hypothetical protein
MVGLTGLAGQWPLASYAQSLLKDLPAERGDMPWGLWKHQPSIVVIAEENDPRLKAVHEAVGFWNAELAALRSWFQLGSVYHVARLLPANDFRPSQENRFHPFTNPPQRIREVDGDIVVALTKDNFNPFTFGWLLSMLGPLQPIKVLIGIPSEQWGSVTLPHGAMRNIVAHELGHAIGLGHNQDSNTMMCGSTPSCGLNFPSEGFHPLTVRDKTRLIEMYPFDRQDSRPLRRWQGDPPGGPSAG